MNKYEKREKIISYLCPCVSLFRTRYAFIFGTRHGISNFVEDTLSLYRQGLFENLIISGGITEHGISSEARIISQALIKRGIPEDILILEDKAMNTGQNVAFARETLKDLCITELLLIGKISSKRRYIMTVRKQWPEIRRICCHGVNYFSCAEEQWWKDRKFRERVLSECRKIRSYVEKGFITDISIVDGIVI
jgi:uncharacterized SAM-binding protein YcdF (DUF218 family)